MYQCNLRFETLVLKQSGEYDVLTITARNSSLLQRCNAHVTQVNWDNRPLYFSIYYVYDLSCSPKAISKTNVAQQSVYAHVNNILIQRNEDRLYPGFINVLYFMHAHALESI